MTAPIQEPTTDRAIQGFAYQRDQLLRRPAPVSSGFTPVVFQGAQLTGGFQTINSGVEESLTWNSWNNGDDTIFTTVESGGLLQAVIGQEPGIYAVGFQLSIQSLTSTAQLVMIVNDDFDQPNQVVYPAEIAGSGGYYSYTTDVRPYPPFQSGDTGDPEFSFDVAHNHGSGRNTLFGTAFWIIYFGPFVTEASS